MRKRETNALDNPKITEVIMENVTPSSGKSAEKIIILQLATWNERRKNWYNKSLHLNKSFQLNSCSGVSLYVVRDDMFRRPIHFVYYFLWLFFVFSLFHFWFSPCRRYYISQRYFRCVLCAKLYSKYGIQATTMILNIQWLNAYMHDHDDDNNICLCKVPDN